jgi:hypothetical protein
MPGPMELLFLTCVAGLVYVVFIITVADSPVNDHTPPAILGGMRTRFGLRTALWIIALAAILAGWMADRSRLEMRHRQSALELTEALARAKMRHRQDALELSKANARANVLESQFQTLRLKVLQDYLARQAELNQPEKSP